MIMQCGQGILNAAAAISLYDKNDNDTKVTRIRKKEEGNVT
jgi:hypothetical protein